MFSRKIFAAAFGAVILASGISANADTATANTTTLGLKDRFTASYIGWYTGQSLADPTGSFQGQTLSDEAGASKSAVTLDNYLDVAIKLDNNWKIGAVGVYTLAPSLDPVTNANKGIDGTLQNPYLKASKGGINLGAEGLNLATNFRYYVPVTSASHNVHNMGNLRADQDVTYDIPNTRFQLESYTFIRSRLYTDSVAAAGSKELELYFYPAVKYQATSTLQAVLSAEPVILIKRVGTGGFKNDPTTLDPGLSWDITPSINFNPWVQIYTEAPTMKNSTVVAVLAAKLI